MAPTPSELGILHSCAENPPRISAGRKRHFVQYYFYYRSPCFLPACRNHSRQLEVTVRSRRHGTAFFGKTIPNSEIRVHFQSTFVQPCTTFGTKVACYSRSRPCATINLNVQGAAALVASSPTLLFSDYKMEHTGIKVDIL
jgi:hypothetical protein